MGMGYGYGHGYMDVDLGACQFEAYVPRDGGRKEVYCVSTVRRLHIKCMPRP